MRYGNTVLVTGGTSGIGLATARLLAQRGYTVYAASRSASGPVEAMTGGGSIRPVVMDVTSAHSVASCVATILAEAGEIGIVVHSAGIGVAGAAADTPDEAARRQFETNYFGLLTVNRAVLPGMIAAGRGLVVIVSSVAALFPIPFQSHYSSSKAALEAYGRALRMECRPYGVQVALVQPGDTKTGFTASRTYDVDPASPFYDACHKSVARMEHDEQNGRPPETVARRIVALTDKAHPPARNVVGPDYNALVLASRMLPVSFIDWALGKMYIRK